MVEADRDVARELEVLALVVAHGDAIGVVSEDVGRHQHRVVEQADAHRLLTGRLVLELRHAAKLPECRHAVQDPGELGVLEHVTLDEEHALLGVEARGQQEHHRAPGPLGELVGVVGQRHRVEVDDAVERFVGCRGLVLGRHPVAHRTEIVPEMLLARGLDSRKDARHGA